MMLQGITDLYPQYHYYIKNINKSQLYCIIKNDLGNKEDETYNNIEKIIKTYI
jgi:hypothetical protein